MQSLLLLLQLLLLIQRLSSSTWRWWFHYVFFHTLKSLWIYLGIFSFLLSSIISLYSRFKLWFLIQSRKKEKKKMIQLPLLSLSSLEFPVNHFSSQHNSSQNAMPLIKIFTFKGTMISHLINITKQQVPNNLFGFHNQCLLGGMYPSYQEDTAKWNAIRLLTAMNTLTSIIIIEAHLIFQDLMFSNFFFPLEMLSHIPDINFWKNPQQR